MGKLIIRVIITLAVASFIPLMLELDKSTTSWLVIAILVVGAIWSYKGLNE